MRVSDKVKLIEPGNKDLTVSDQCALLNLGRSSFYYKRQGVNEKDVFFMGEIDKIYTKYPFYGVPQDYKGTERYGKPGQSQKS